MYIKYKEAQNDLGTSYMYDLLGHREFTIKTFRGLEAHAFDLLAFHVAL